MNRNNYDFSNLERAMSHLKTNQGRQTLNEIKIELNKFFKDSRCVEVYFTKNYDKPFFGMTTYMALEKEDVIDTFTGDKGFRIKAYFLEIDSKLLDIGLTTKELTAIILHEVGHLVNDTTPSEEVKHAIDGYLEKTKDTIDIGSMHAFVRFLEFGISDSIRKFTSIFTRNDEEILADEFVVICGYGDYLESGYRKISKSGKMLNKNVSNKLIALEWTMRTYKNMDMYRIPAIRALNKSKNYTASVLEKREINEVIDFLKTTPSKSVRECTCNWETSIIVEGATLLEEQSKGGLIKKLQINGLKGLEADVYEYQMRINNVEDQDDAILLMRQINTRMSVLDDYLMNATDIDNHSRERWERCFDKYDRLREELSKKVVYSRKNYGLYYDFNYLDTKR